MPVMEKWTQASHGWQSQQPQPGSAASSHHLGGQPCKRECIVPCLENQGLSCSGQISCKRGVQPFQHGSHGILWACSGNPWKSSMTLYNLGRFSLERRCLLLGLAGIRKSSHGRVVQGTHGRGSTDSMT